MSNIQTKKNAIKKSELFLGTTLVILCISLFFVLSQDQRQLLIPVSIIIFSGFFLLAKIYRIEGRIPIFDAGFFMIAITGLYILYPYIVFMITGFEWTVVSDNRMRSYNPGASDLGSFAWFHVAYFLSLILGYLKYRPKIAMNSFSNQLKINLSECRIALIVFSGLIAWGIFMPLVFGDNRPHIISQLHNMFASVKFVFSIFFLAFCFSHWKIKTARLAVFLYLGYELLNILLGEAGRTWVFLHFCAAAMLYDRLVNPFKVGKLVILSSSALFAFIALGFYRHGAGDGFRSALFFLSGSNEFQSMLGTAYDIYMRKEILGTWGEIPIQVYFDDIVYSIPSQLLSFEKVDLSSWYLKVIGIYGEGAAFMFGVTSQGIVGWGIPELIIRGFLTGAIFGWLHKYYLRNQESFWILVFYVFIAIKSYYIFRASTGYIPYFIIYNYLPAYLAVKFLKASITNHKKIKYT